MSAAATTLAVQAFFRAVAIDADHLTVAAADRQGRRRYVIGPSPDAQAPVSAAFIDGPALTLALATEAGFVIEVTRRMAGQIEMDGVVTPLSVWIERHGTRFILPPPARAEIVCGEITFVLGATTPGPMVPRPLFTWRWREQRYTAASGAALLLIVLVAALVPPDAKALSFDRVSAQLRFAAFLVTPPESRALPLPAGTRAAGSNAAAAPGPTGALGDRTSKQRHQHLALRGPSDNQDPHLAHQRGDEVRQAGILGLLRPDPGSPLASILGRATALGSDEASALGDLSASHTGDAYAIGGLGVIGTGAGGAAGDGVLGTGKLVTIGSRGDRRWAAGYGPGGPADLGRHRLIAPDYLVGQPVVRGALDKEIIRRIIRRHINEVKYCYEQELLRHQDLAGRIAVNFTIAPSGQVAAAVVQSTTMANARVEGCLVGAVRRWEFPKPAGGGLVIATYPFSFMAAGREAP